MISKSLGSWSSPSNEEKLNDEILSLLYSSFPSALTREPFDCFEFPEHPHKKPDTKPIKIKTQMLKRIYERL
jgi:hypothetical protein